jgi:hypothetical protein
MAVGQNKAGCWPFLDWEVRKGQKVGWHHQGACGLSPVPILMSVILLLAAVPYRPGPKYWLREPAEGPAVQVLSCAWGGIPGSGQSSSTDFQPGPSSPMLHRLPFPLGDSDDWLHAFHFLSGRSATLESPTAHLGVYSVVCWGSDLTLTFFLAPQTWCLFFSFQFSFFWWMNAF